MFIVLLKFSRNQDQAARHLDGHKDWVKSGFEAGIFLLAGSLEPSLGGAVLAHNTSLAALQRRVNEDPFVAANVVRAEIYELDPGKADERLRFLVH
jgi:uncharacterized protein YciI